MNGSASAHQGLAAESSLSSEVDAGRVGGVGPSESIFILASLLWLLVGPRLSLLNVGGSSIRVEDFLLVAMGLIVLARWKRFPRKLAAAGIPLVLTVSLLATAVGVWSGRVDIGAALFYSLRVSEYWVVLPALCLVIIRFGLRAVVVILGWVTVLQVLASALQTIGGVSVGFSKFSYERGAGLTAGPYELGAICAMLAVFWLWRRNWILTATSLVGVVLSASRVSIPALLVGAAFMFIVERTRPGESRTRSSVGGLNVLLTVFSLVFALLIYAFYPTIGSKLEQPIIGRLQDTTAVQSWQAAGAMASAYSNPVDSHAYSFLAYDSLGLKLSQGDSGFGTTADDSNVVRFFRWHILLNAIDTPVTAIFGLGPSFAGPSVDGSYMRIFAETGLLGLAAWFVLFRRWFTGASPWLFGVLVTILVGGLFIDIMVALRPMVLMWTLMALSRVESFSGKTLSP